MELLTTTSGFGSTTEICRHKGGIMQGIPAQTEGEKG